MQQQTGCLSAPSSNCDKQQDGGASMHCAGELDTDNRGVGASKVDAAAQDGVGGSTSGNPGAPELYSRAPDSTPEFDAAQNPVSPGDPGAPGLNATVGVTASELYAAI